MKIILSSLFCLFVITAYSQETGLIMYEEKMDLHKRLPEDRQQYKDMIPQFRTANFELHFTSEETMYFMSKEQEEVAPPPGGGGRMMRFRAAGAEDRKVYKNLDKNELVDSRTFMDKKFLIRGALDETEWKVTGEQIQVLEYLCLKATYQDSNASYVAWFTPQIPISSGPADFSGLPGLILKVDVNDGERTITATSLTEQEVDKDILKEPKKGKEVTSEEFREIVHEKMKEMHEAGGGPGGHRVIIRQ